MFIMEAHNCCHVVEQPHIISPPWPINNLISSIYKFGFQCFLVVNQIAYKKVLMFGDVVLAPSSWSITKCHILSRTWCWQLMNCGAWWPLLLNILWSLTTTPDCFPVLTLVASARIMLIEPQSLYSSITSEIPFAMLSALPSFRSSTASFISESGFFKTTAWYSRPSRCLPSKQRDHLSLCRLSFIFSLTCKNEKQKQSYANCNSKLL